MIGSIGGVVHSLCIGTCVGTCGDLFIEPAVFFQKNPEVMCRPAAKPVEFARLKTLDTVLCGKPDNCNGARLPTRQRMVRDLANYLDRR